MVVEPASYLQIISRVVNRNLPLRALQKDVTESSIEIWIPRVDANAFSHYIDCFRLLSASKVCVSKIQINKPGIGIKSNRFLVMLNGFFNLIIRR